LSSALLAARISADPSCRVRAAYGRLPENSDPAKAKNLQKNRIGLPVSACPMAMSPGKGREPARRVNGREPTYRQNRIDAAGYAIEVDFVERRDQAVLLGVRL
jgi:hypothetical protein